MRCLVKLEYWMLEGLKQNENGTGWTIGPWREENMAVVRTRNASLISTLTGAFDGDAAIARPARDHLRRPTPRRAAGALYRRPQDAGFLAALPAIEPPKPRTLPRV